MGHIYKRGHKYWIKYYRDGVPHRESSGSEKESAARNLLKLREGDVARGVPITPKANRVRFEEAAEDVVRDYKVNGKRSIGDVQRRFELHLKPFFDGRRMASITPADVQKYVDQRQESGASNAQINRELAALKRAFSLGIQSEKLTHKPYIAMLQEDNVRTGFFEREQFEKGKRPANYTLP